jgi:hypothetical protein
MPRRSAFLELAAAGSQTVSLTALESVTLLPLLCVLFHSFLYVSVIVCCLCHIPSYTSIALRLLVRHIPMIVMNEVSRYQQ